MISVVIPAHNEETTIVRCLGSLLEGAEADEIEIIVACNGCSDDTQEKALSVGGPVTIVESAVPSKTAALNLGDAAASGFPRFYVDADVLVNIHSIRAVATVLDRGAALVAAPSLDLDTSRSSLLVRSYYRLWTMNPSVRDDVVGRGVFAVSRQGRERFSSFPELIADDHFVRTRFARSERAVVAAATSTVNAPRTTRALVRRRLRVINGNREIAQNGTGFLEADSPWVLLRTIRRRPWLASSLPAYLTVTLVSRLVARLRPNSGWGRDDSRDDPSAFADAERGPRH